LHTARRLGRACEHQHGEWLEYADPQNAVDQVLGRNPHIENYSVPVKLSGTDGKIYDTKVYHPIGFLLTTGWLGSSLRAPSHPSRNSYSYSTEGFERMKQWLRDFVHNCIVHPLLPFLPRQFGNDLHRKNAAWAFGEE